MSKILFLVESYWGAGHMNVTAEVARALIKAGHSVTIASSQSSFDVGGTFDYGAADKLVLPLLMKDEHGKPVITTSGKKIGDDQQACAERTNLILEKVDSQKFDSALIEAWPFGVDPFDIPFSQILQALKQRGLPIHGLARDVLGYPEIRQDNQRAHDMISADFAARYLSRIFVTSDPALCTLKDSLHPDAFTYLEAANIPIEHVGYVGAAAGMPATASMADPNRPVLIAGGGSFKGAVREHMLRTVKGVAEAKLHTSLAQNPLLVIVGSEANEADMVLLNQYAGKNAKIIKNLPAKDFRQIVANAATVIHKGGRNTAIDCIQVLQNRPVAQLITPMADEKGIWLEAKIRSEVLQNAGLSVTVSDEALSSPEACAHLLETSLARAHNKHAHGLTIKLGGADILARLLTQFSSEPAPQPSSSPARHTI